MSRDALLKLLLRHGMAPCSECTSWTYNTKAAKNFHARRCGG